MTFTLKEFIANLKSVYGDVNVTVVNVETLSSVSVASYILDLDAKLIATDGTLSAHKTEQYVEDDNYKLKSSVNVRKAKWIVIASIAVKEDSNVVVNVSLNIVGDAKFTDIADDKINAIMRI